MRRPSGHIKVNRASKGRGCVLGGAGLSHAAPLHGGVQNLWVRTGRAEQNRLLHVGAQTGQRQDVQHTEALVRRHTHGDEVGVEA